MKLRRRITGAIALAVLASGLGALPARAQTQAVREACKASVRQLCPKEVAAFDVQAARACLVRNVAKADPACKAAIEAYRAQQHQAASAN